MGGGGRRERREREQRAGKEGGERREHGGGSKEDPAHWHRTALPPNPPPAPRPAPGRTCRAHTPPARRASEPPPPPPSARTRRGSPAQPSLGAGRSHPSRGPRPSSPCKPRARRARNPGGSRLGVCTHGPPLPWFDTL